MNKIKNYYYNLKIKDKLLFALLTAAILPMLLFFLLFSTRIYDMIAADTIQKQQTASMSVAPKLNTIIDGVVRDSNYVHSRNHFENMLIHDTEASFAGFKESTLGEEFLNALSASGDQSPTTSIQLYTNLPEDHPAYRDPDFSRHVQPISEITRTYWYGIFQGSNILQLHCPKFY
ncbi:MAG: hypothetical protein IKX76_01025, partial [Eubacterium sp.]|nr:hypothetical protein [Eubacterium sp.]